MILNKYSYVHKQISACCYLFEQASGLKLVTNLYTEFKDIRFSSPLSYVTVDFEHNTIFVMCVKLKKADKKLLEDLLLYCRWLYVGKKYVGTKKEPTAFLQ